MKTASVNTQTFRFTNFALQTALVAAAVCPPWQAHAQAVIPSDAKPTCTVAAPVFASWFKSGSVTVDGEVNPANSVTFPDIPNCSFYQWSEQMFLWLTSPTPATYGGGGGRIFDSPVFFDVSGLDANGQRVYIPHRAGRPKLINVRSSQVGPNGLQTMIDKRGKMFEILPARISPAGRSVIRDISGAMVEIHGIEAGVGDKVTFLDRRAKKISVAALPKMDTTLAQRVAPRLAQLTPIASQNFVQAFKSDKNVVTFLDRNGNRVTPTQGQAGDSAVLLAQNGSLVYYATMVNDVYAYFQTNAANTGISPTLKFPTTQAELNLIIAFAATRGTTFPDPEALAIKAKTSWIEANGLDTTNYVTATAVVPEYDKTNPVLWIPTGTKTVSLMMSGMHVVGSAKGHPEMIWATFEHLTNTPAAAYSYINASNQTINVPQSATGTWLFSSTNNAAATYNVAHASFVAPNIQAEPGQTISPSDTIRWKAWGKASSPGNPAASNTEIISINNSVMNQLGATDVRRNYMMTGSTWTIFGASPNGANEVGTNQLANTTMETYQQGASTLKDGSNCFSCHSTNLVDVSHVFRALKPLFP